jgi:RNA polymerase sigma factor (sigma-70 family)
MNRLDQEAFLKAYNELAGAIYRHCFFRVYTKARAQELTQETFAKVWQYIHSGHPVANLKAFLYQTANHLIIDESRKKKEESLEKRLADFPSFEPAADSKSNIENDMLLHDLKKHIKKLPPETQQLLAYRFIDDLEPQEIAIILEITPNNASVRINRAVAQLKELQEGNTP